MTRVLDLGSLQIGDRVQDTLLVLDAEQKSFDGGAYTVLTFGNATGRLPSAPFFDKDLSFVEGVRRGHVVQVIGEVAEYRGRRQLRVTAPLRLLPAGAVDLNQLLPTVGDVGRYWDVLDGWRREISKPRLARVLGLFYDDDEFRTRYGRCPASVNGHAGAKPSSMGEALREAEAFGEALVPQRKFWQLDYRRAYRGVSDWGSPPAGE